MGEIVKIGGKWKPFAALWQWIKSGFKDTIALREIIGIWPHYQSEMVKSLEVFDKTEEGHSLAIEMGLMREDA